MILRGVRTYPRDDQGKYKMNQKDKAGDPGTSAQGGKNGTETEKTLKLDPGEAAGAEPQPEDAGERTLDLSKLTKAQKEAILDQQMTIYDGGYRGRGKLIEISLIVRLRGRFRARLRTSRSERREVTAYLVNLRHLHIHADHVIVAVEDDSTDLNRICPGRIREGRFEYLADYLDEFPEGLREAYAKHAKISYGTIEGRPSSMLLGGPHLPLDADSVRTLDSVTQSGAVREAKRMIPPKPGRIGKFLDTYDRSHDPVSGKYTTLRHVAVGLGFPAHFMRERDPDASLVLWRAFDMYEDLIGAHDDFRAEQLADYGGGITDLVRFVERAHLQLTGETAKIR
jgi:hypothetical protein